MQKWKAAGIASSAAKSLGTGKKKSREEAKAQSEEAQRMAMELANSSHLDKKKNGHKSSNKSRSSVSSLEENNEDIGDVPDQKNDKWNDLRRTKSLMEKPPRKSRLKSVDEIVDEVVQKNKKPSSSTSGYQSYLETGKKSVKK